MTFSVPPGRYHPRILMQRAGYSEFGQGKSPQESSYIRRLGSQFYPRLHAYLTMKPNEWRITLHLDQKQASYRGVRRHSGEYDSEIVEQEAARLKSFLNS